MRVNTKYRNYTNGTSSMLFVAVVVVLFNVAVINAFAGTQLQQAESISFVIYLSTRSVIVGN